MNTVISFLLLLILLVGSSYADYAPDMLFVKMRAAVRTSVLDGQLETTSNAVNAVVAAGAVADVPLAQYSELSPALERIIRLRVSSSQDLENLVAQLSTDSEVEWVTVNNRYSSGQLLDDQYVPIDSLYPDAWWLEKISAGLAWEITRGDSTVVIGIIDTGVDYTHRDLRHNIWHNVGEIPENGIDDDQNGFVDDVIGWDFVDAPSLPVGGDYLDRDNDPMDEFGHGTYVAGCAAATSDNPDCFPSIGFNCRIMPLRAGNSNGTLEEDDVASALLYGASNGAAIINMSFGDVVASPLLREVVTIVHEAGVVLVASAGNANNDGIHYPSGFPEVISVGATDQFDRRATFSNRGPTVDIMAPGVAIGSTILGGECGQWVFPSGTSYAAPIVAGVAGLILSVNHALSPDDVTDILKSSAEDLQSDGWDPETVNGRVDARRAVESAAFGSEAVARIVSPAADSGVRGTFAIIGDAQGTAFLDFTLEFGLGENPSSWTRVSSASHRVLNDTLGFVQAPSQDTVLVIRLNVRGTTMHQSVDMAHVYVQNGTPSIDSLKIRPVLDGPGYGQQVLAWSDQICRASLLMTNSSGDSIREDFGYVSDEHVAVISQSRYPGVWQAILQVTNLLGEFARSTPFQYTSIQNEILPFSYNAQSTTAPHGVLGGFTSDYDCDGLDEIWLLPVDENNLVDTLEVYEWDGSDFVETENTYGPHIPQCFGDADGDGLLEVGARRFLESRIWEQTDSCGILNNIVFQSSNQFDEFLIGRFVRIDSASGRDDIFARVGMGSTSRFALFSVSPDYQLTLRDTLINISSGPNSIGPPGSAVGDVDNDGFVDIFFGDYDGDIVWSEWNGSEMVSVWSTRLRQNDATSWMAVGDVDCDGIDELVAGCRSNATASSESQRLLMGWDYYIFDAIGNNELSIIDSILILGNENVSFNPATVTTSDVNVDGCDEILISAYPDLYIITRNQDTGRYVPEWYFYPSTAGAIAIADFNHNGIDEFVVSDGDRQVRIENAVAMTNAPFPPVLSGFPEDESSVSLSWSHVQGAEHYELYSALQDGGFQLLSVVTDTAFYWQGVTKDTTYRFVVATYDTAFEQPISVFSNVLELTPNSPPVVQDTADHVAPRTVAVTFSESMSSSVFVQGNWRLDDGQMPAVIAESAGTKVIFLSFDEPFLAGQYELQLRNLRDAQGTPLPESESSVVFSVEAAEQLPVFVVSHRLVDAPVGHRIEIQYSEPMTDDAVVATNYQVIDPRRSASPYIAKSVRFTDVDHSVVEVSIDERYPAGATGVEVRVQIASIAAQSGLLLEETSLLISESAVDLASAYVYPNPFRGRGAAGTDGVYFAALPQSAVIRIFTLNGVMIRKIDHNGATGHTLWDLRNQAGEQVGSGIYLFSIEADGEETMGKLAIMR